MGVTVDDQILNAIKDVRPEWRSFLIQLEDIKFLYAVSCNSKDQAWTEHCLVRIANFNRLQSIVETHSDLPIGDLLALPGIGQTNAVQVISFLATGLCSRLEELVLNDDFPPLSVKRIYNTLPKLTCQQVGYLYFKYGVRDLEDIEKLLEVKDDILLPIQQAYAHYLRG